MLLEKVLMFGNWCASWIVTSFKRRKSPQGRSEPSDLVCRTNGNDQKFWSAAVTFSTIPRRTISSHAAFPLMAFGEPGSNGLAFDRIGRVPPVFIVCLMECFTSLKKVCRIISLEHNIYLVCLCLHLSLPTPPRPMDNCAPRPLEPP